MISLADSQPLKTNLFSPNLLPRAFSLALGPGNEVVFHQRPVTVIWVSPCFGYPRVLGTPVSKSLVFWVSPVGIPKTLKELNTADWGK